MKRNARASPRKCKLLGTITAISYRLNKLQITFNSIVGHDTSSAKAGKEAILYTYLVD